MSDLTEKQVQEKRALLSAYQVFWDNVAFRKGWSTPAFTFDEAFPFLDKAADYVIRIRELLTGEEPENAQVRKKRSQVGAGSAHEFLWAVEKETHPLSSSGAFIRGLVHATFCDGREVELTETKLDELMSKVDEALVTANEEEEKSRLLFKDLVDTWKMTSDNVNKLMSGWESGSGSDSEVEREHSSKNVLFGRILEALNKLNAAVDNFHQEKHEKLEEKVKESSEAVEAGEESEDTEGQNTDDKDAAAEVNGEEVNESEKMETSTSAEQLEDSEEETASADAEEQNTEKDASLLKVETVAREVGEVGHEVKNLSKNAQLLELPTLMENPEEAEKVIEALHSQCLKYSNQLMNDLEVLDTIVGHEEIRPKRKAQVKNIQFMLEDVDSIKTKLHALQKQIKSTLEQERAKKQAEEAKQAEKEPETKKVKIERTPPEVKHVVPSQGASKRGPDAISLANLEPYWKKMRLQPKMDVNETQSAYILTTYVPSMKKEDIKVMVSEDGSTLTVEGVRLPSTEDEQQLLRQIKLRLGDEFDPLTEEQRAMLLLRVGAGRFGKFSESFRLPRNVSHKVIPTYDKGYLKIEIPKSVRPTRPHPARTTPFGDPFFSNAFFNDPDMFWG